MKVKTVVTETEIECSADELRQSSSLAESFSNALRRCFISPSVSDCNFDEEDEESEEEK